MDIDPFSSTSSSTTSQNSSSTIDPLLLRPPNGFNTPPTPNGQLTIDVSAANTSQPTSLFPFTPISSSAGAGYTHRQRIVSYHPPLPSYQHQYPHHHQQQQQLFNIPGWPLALPPLPSRPATAASASSLPAYPFPNFGINTNINEQIPCPFPRTNMPNPTPHSAPAQIPTFFLSSQVHVTQHQYQWPHVHIQAQTSRFQPDFTFPTTPVSATRNERSNFMIPQTPKPQSRTFGTIVEFTPSPPLDSQEESIDSDDDSDYDDQYIPHPILVHAIFPPSHSQSVPTAVTAKGSSSSPPHSPVGPAQPALVLESGIEGEEELESISSDENPLHELPLLEEGTSWDRDKDDDEYLPRSRPRTRSSRRVVKTSLKSNSNNNHKNKNKKKRSTIVTPKSKIAIGHVNDVRYRKQCQAVVQKGRGEKIGPTGSFLWKLYKVLPNPKYFHLVTWNAKERIATILDVHEFAAEMCPSAFEMNTYKWDSFKRQCTFPWGIKRSQLDKTTNSQTIYLPPWNHIVARWSTHRDIAELVESSGLAADWEIPVESERPASKPRARAKGKKANTKDKAKVKVNNLLVMIDPLDYDSVSSEEIPLSLNHSKSKGDRWKGDARLPTSCIRLSPIHHSDSESEDEDIEKIKGPNRLFTPTPPPLPCTAESSNWGRGLTPPTNEIPSTLHTLMPFSPSAEERRRLSQIPKIPTRATRGGKTAK